MSDWTPLAILSVALVGAWGVALLQQAIATGQVRPWVLVRSGVDGLREPLSRPDQRDAVLFHTAPALLVLAAVLTLAFVPWAPGFRGIDLSTGAIAVPAALAYVTPAIFMAGWGAGRPLAVVAGFRWIALMLAYAMPIAMVVTAVAAPAGSLRLSVIVDAQHAVPTAIVQPLALALWLPAASAVCFLPPFDLPHAPSELGGGAFGEYTGLDAALIRLAQRILVVAMSAMTVVLFGAGWHGPVLPPAVWMTLKTAIVAALALWVGGRVPRVQIDRLLPFAWKVANPLALLAIAWAGLVTLVFYR
ncbi:complex I subunit 1 family protein [Patulibacter sp. NPDC049589]|uniref:complex I subunit 1 family protein n=1 Tax=Patulibacter sp. NPDC049589 TaxID=3154731 RepID=UPI0034411F3C